MSVWITRLSSSAPGGLLVAVKDAIDVAGVVTTAGSAPVRARSETATADAACLSGVRAAGAVIVGKTTLTEMCVSPVGDNAVFGTPVNPLAPSLIPGGSSSGSAVAVATGEVDLGLGTDTGGSVRIPAACCGVVGLKTTWGRVPLGGVWPLAPSLDVVGPIARDVSGVVEGMRLLAPDWAELPAPARVVGRLRIEGVEDAVEKAIDQALKGLEVREVWLPGWDDTYEALDAIILGELWQAHHALLDADGVGEFVNGALHAGRDVTPRRLRDALAYRAAWQAEVSALLREVDVLALPTLVADPPPLSDFTRFPLTLLTAPFNLAGVPALAMPVPSDGPVPVSLQLVGPLNGEELLCATGLALELSLRR
ncbi:amidase [Actinoplanes sp. TRM 88003]|uniref:Amidase n=1 Tax=Paractinoplanes aksuensis TaxID=2939490 RepID=A0ABT1E0G1_9ACTN|nr:amidase [Actinoplanes aksuensis]MCO8276589.1 amidase [Actinoplanes aksuensis]